MSEQPPGKACDRASVQPSLQADSRIDKALSLLGHELRNPIAAISMGAEALARMCASNPDQLAIVDVIRRQSQQTSRLLEQLLDLARVNSGLLPTHVERFDVIDRLRKTLFERGGQAGTPPLNVDLCPPTAPAIIQADAARISQAFGQLIEHIAAAAPGGPLAITTERSGERITIGIGRPDAAGESQEVQDIFEPLREAPRTGGGFMVGVALAKRLIEMFGGSIEARGDKAGKAISFRVSLPLDDESPREADRPGGAAAPAGPRRVLIIDDSPDVVMSLEFLLQQTGHQTTSAVDGARGIELAKSSRPDVIVCDIGLPGMNGYEVARQLRADPETAAIYLIAVSGFAGEEDERRSLEAGFDLHLNKPQGFVGLAELLLKAPISPRLPQ
jgi:CheY-like chemotaxis protein